MSLILTVLLVVQVLSALAIIFLVLFQQGKGADMGSSFGTGSAGSLFGASGAANFLSRMTKWAAIVFFSTTAGLAYVSHKSTQMTSAGPADVGVMRNFPVQDRSVPQLPGQLTPAAGSSSSVPVAPTTPAVPATPAVPVTPDASVPQVPAAPAAPTPDQ